MSATVLLDADGVLLKFSQPLLDGIGSDRTEGDVSQMDIFTLIDAWHGPERTAQAKDLLSRPEWWAAQPALEGAVEAVELIRATGAQVKVITQPWLPCFGWDTVRRRRLFELFGIPERDVGSFHDKFMVRADLLIDDHPKHIQQWSEAHDEGTALLYDAPYNKSFQWGARIDWRSGLPQLRDILAAL